MSRHVKRHGKPQRCSFKNVTNYNIPESVSPHELHLRILKEDNSFERQCVSAILLTAAEMAVEIFIM